jgi:hypothetical protein
MPIDRHSRLIRQGKIISRNNKNVWNDKPFNESKEVLVGYCHILGNDLDNAFTI